MKIHLPSVKTVVFTCALHKARQERVASVLEKRGFKDFRFVHGLVGLVPYWKNLIPRMLRLYRTEPVPFLFLQDDVMETAEYRDEVNVPDDAQLAFIGGSYWDLKFTERPDEWLLLHSMYCDHSVLYLDRAATGIIADEIEKDNQEKPYDVSLAATFDRVKTYCLKKPYYYQKDGYNEGHTQDFYPIPPVLRPARMHYHHDPTSGFDK